MQKGNAGPHHKLVTGSSGAAAQGARVVSGAGGCGRPQHAVGDDVLHTASRIKSCEPRLQFATTRWSEVNANRRFSHRTDTRQRSRRRGTFNSPTAREECEADVVSNHDMRRFATIMVQRQRSCMWSRLLAPHELCSAALSDWTGRRRVSLQLRLYNPLQAGRGGGGGGGGGGGF